MAIRIDIITALPNLLRGPFDDSILKRAQQKGLAEIKVHDLRSFSTKKHKNIDDYAYGGEAGMVLSAEPIAACLKFLQSQRDYDEIIYLTPDGKTLTQSMANQLSGFKNLILLCGHYKGIDERIREKYITREISIGDYVLSGGELAAAVLTDAIVRLLPGVLNDVSSALSDSFQDDLLAPPVYTRPAEFEGMQVPEVLLSGNEKEIEKWRLDQSVQRTKNRRPDIWKRHIE